MPLIASTGVDITLTIGLMMSRRIPAAKTETAMNSETELPMVLDAPLSFLAPIALANVTVVPIANPTIMTVRKCMNWLPIDTAVVLATPSYSPITNRSASP